MDLWEGLVEAAQPYDPSKAAYSDVHAREYLRLLHSLTPDELAAVEKDIDHVGGEHPVDPVSALAGVQMSVGLYRLRQERKKARELAEQKAAVLRTPNDRHIDALGRSDAQDINTGGMNEEDSDEEVPGVLDPVEILRSIRSAIGPDGEDKQPNPIEAAPVLHPQTQDGPDEIDTFKDAMGDPDKQAEVDGQDDQGAIGFEPADASGQTAFEQHVLWKRLTGE